MRLGSIEQLAVWSRLFPTHIRQTSTIAFANKLYITDITQRKYPYRPKLYGVFGRFFRPKISIINAGDARSLVSYRSINRFLGWVECLTIAQKHEARPGT